MKAVNGIWLVGNVASGWWKIQYTVWKWWVACVTAICSLLSPNCKLYNKMWQSSIMPQGTNNFIIFFLTSLKIGKNTDFYISVPFYKVEIGPFLGLPIYLFTIFPLCATALSEVETWAGCTALFKVGQMSQSVLKVKLEARQSKVRSMLFLFVLILN